ncbi:unnamed protein product, partial [Prunus brigantina]
VPSGGLGDDFYGYVPAWARTTASSLGADDVGQARVCAGRIIPTSGFCFMECTLLGGWLGWESQHSSSSCTCTQFQSNRGLLAGYKLIAERQKREVILLVISLPRRSLGGTGGAWPLVIGSVRLGRPS